MDGLVKIIREIENDRMKIIQNTVGKYKYNNKLNKSEIMRIHF